ncbi:hypothetical protein DYB32_000869 [Aphanomyces invadans]|uniref:Delta(24)-sterol reductase n=1 Tax=Aphanomyces invadans TaxID=157072 RepID=A0A3R6VHG0_9STRA|nr:hypothetical protein DYB32_000869 [Aphanomyces invadans]
MASGMRTKENTPSIEEAADAAGQVVAPQPTSLTAHVLINYRWVFVCFFLLPLSFFYDIWYYLRNKVIFYANSAPTKHTERVRQVQEQVLKWNKDGRKAPMCTARPGWQNISYRRGLYKKTLSNIKINMMDVLKVDTAAKDVNPDLFYAVPWSYGTLGFLTAVEIQIVPTKQYYHPVSSLDEACHVFESASKDTEANHFVEALMFTLNKGVVMTGSMVNQVDSTKVNAIGTWHKPWFFKHVEAKFDQRAADRVEYIPLRDYFHRHSRSIFWEIQDIIPFGNHVVFRYLLGWLVPPKVSLLKLTQSDAIKQLYDNHHFIQDMLVPMTRLKEALKVYPLWLCPFVLPSRPGMLQTNAAGDTLFVDIGAYGVPHVANFHPVHTTRRIEAFVRDNDGCAMIPRFECRVCNWAF